MLKPETMIILRTLIAVFLGGIIGWERGATRQGIGIRTYSLVSMGACCFALISIHIVGTNSARVAAQIITGIGFLGAGVIIREQGKITGLTTAATLWATAAIGLACAYGMYLLAGINTLIILLLLPIKKLKKNK